MPTYKNNGLGPVSIETIGGAPDIIEPGETKETMRFYNKPDMILVSETPLWNPMAMEPTDIDLGDLGGTPYVSSISGFSGAVIPVPEDALHIYIMKISGSITVRRQSKDGPVEMLEKSNAYPYHRIEAAGTITRLLVSGFDDAGTFQIQMYRRSITN